LTEKKSSRIVKKKKELKKMSLFDIQKGTFWLREKNQNSKNSKKTKELNVTFRYSKSDI
jgi:hypothetical protein